MSIKQFKRALYLFYFCLPEFIKDAIGKTLGFIPKFQWKPTFEEIQYYQRLCSSEFLSSEELRQIQLFKLKAILTFCFKSVPYYKRLFDSIGFFPGDIKSLDDLKGVPILTKQLIRENFSDLICQEYCNPKKLSLITTSGSTGTPMKFYFDPHMVGVRRAHWWRWSQFANVDLYKDKMVYCGGQAYWRNSKIYNHGLQSILRDRLILLPAAMDGLTLDNYVQDLIKFNGDYVRGYASAIYKLSNYLLAKGIVVP
ncbi:hypothetical protein JW964_23985, partial [candidate division KSB1 bacterium]|nr:hypothetical protein [candidate division KSB1 bacterium]